MDGDKIIADEFRKVFWGSESPFVTLQITLWKLAPIIPGNWVFSGSNKAITREILGFLVFFPMTSKDIL